MADKGSILDFNTEYFDDVPAVIAIMKGPDHVYDYANALYMSVANKTDLLGRPVREALPELEGQGLFEMLDQVYQTGVPLRIEEIQIDYDRFKTGTPEALFFSLYYKPIKNAEGVTEGIFVHGYDITEPVRARLIAKKTKTNFTA